MMPLWAPMPRPAAASTAPRRRPTSRQLNGWIIDQLRLQPYQHVLEVGFGTGRLLEEAARTLRIGFLAGIEPSIDGYKQAYRRNKRFIARQLMQIHLGELPDLPYPPHYFHTVYSTSAILMSKNPESELLRLIRLLRSGGRLVLLFHSKAGVKDTGIRMLTQQLQLDYIAAGLLRPEITTIGTAFGATLAATAITA
ncbi:MAG TPA: class I SAM-dependent methyltransferase [Puia sp.]|jgi:ubiquinone/menaquinone biosynthesis C-methylase UbiE|nr:class I SAM-dependent methyltransferase [Puia sp.]